MALMKQQQQQSTTRSQAGSVVLGRHSFSCQLNEEETVSTFSQVEPAP